MKNHFWQSNEVEPRHVACRDCSEPYSALATACYQPPKTLNDFFKPDNELVVSLVARLFTRNEKSRTEQASQRLQMTKNLSNLTYNPELHLAYCIQLLEKYAEVSEVPSFEIGLVFGAALALCSTSRASEKTLRSILADVVRQQDAETKIEETTSE